MPHCTFSANKSIKGGAAFVKLTRDNSIIFSVFPQIANNTDKKNNFDFKSGINVKFSADEVGGIVQAIRTNGNFKFYHQVDTDAGKSVSKGSFSYYFIEAKGETPVREGFGLIVTKGETTIKVGYSLGAAEGLLEFLRLCLSKIHEDIIVEDDKKDAAYLKSKEQPAAPKTPPKKTAAKKKVEPTPEPEVEPEVEDEKEPVLAVEAEEEW